MKTGDGFSEEDMDIGPLISKDAVSKVVAHVEDAVSKGGKVNLFNNFLFIFRYFTVAAKEQI